MKSNRIDQAKLPIDEAELLDQYNDLLEQHKRLHEQYLSNHAEDTDSNEDPYDKGKDKVSDNDAVDTEGEQTLEFQDGQWVRRKAKNKKNKLVQVAGASVKVAKKTGTGLDDVPAAIGDQLNVAGPFVLAGAAIGIFFVELGEGLSGIEKAYRTHIPSMEEIVAAYNNNLSKMDNLSAQNEMTKAITERNRALKERKIAVMANLAKVVGASTMLAVSGLLAIHATLELVYELMHLPDIVTLALPTTFVALGPLSIPLVLTAFACIDLTLSLTSYHYAKKREVAANQAYETALVKINARMERINTKIGKLLEKKKKLDPRSSSENEQNQLAAIYSNLARKFKETSDLKKELTTLKQKSLDAQKETLKNERALGFAYAEIAIAVAVLALFTLVVVGGIGAGSVATMGTLPSFILLGAVGVGLTIKLADVVDKIFFDSRGTTAIRNTAIQVGKKVGQLWNGFKNYLSGPKVIEEPVLNDETPALQRRAGTYSSFVDAGLLPTSSTPSREPTADTTAQNITTPEMTTRSTHPVVSNDDVDNKMAELGESETAELGEPETSATPVFNS